MAMGVACGYSESGRAQKMASSLYTSDQAYQVLKANFLKLVDEIQPEVRLCDGLWSAGIISDEDYEFSCDESKKTKQRSRKLLFSTFQSVKSNYKHFETMCTLLQESELVNHHKWAAQLKSESYFGRPAVLDMAAAKITNKQAISILFILQYLRNNITPTSGTFIIKV